MREYIPTYLPKETYRRVVSIIRDYPYLKAQLNEARQDVLESSPVPADGQPKGTAVADITFAKASALGRLDMLNWRINAFEEVWKQLGDYEQKIIAERYWRRLPDGSLTSLRRLKPYREIDIPYSQRNIERLHRKFVCCLAHKLREI